MKCLRRSLLKKEPSSSRRSGFASTVSIRLHISQDHASRQYATGHQNVGNLIILCYIFRGPVLKETLFTKPVMLKPWLFQPFLWLPQMIKTLSNTCATATTAESSEILLQIITLKVIGNNGRSITTYGLVDSGSDVTVIDPSLIEQLEIQGEASHLFLSTVNQIEKREQGVKVSFKIASVNDQDPREIAVCGAWAVKDFTIPTIPLKHVSVRKRIGQWPHLRQEPFPEVARNKVSVLIGTNVQEHSSQLKSREGNQTSLLR